MTEYFRYRGPVGAGDTVVAWTEDDGDDPRMLVLYPCNKDLEGALVRKIRDFNRVLVHLEIVGTDIRFSISGRSLEIVGPLELLALEAE